MQSVQIKTKMKDKVINWLLRDTSESYIFILLFVLVLGKTLLPIGIITSLPLYSGASGVILTDEQKQTISDNLSKTFVEIMTNLNQVGYEMKDNFVAKIAIHFYMIAPIVAILFFLVCIFELMRIALKTAYKRIAKR